MIKIKWGPTTLEIWCIFKSPKLLMKIRDRTLFIEDIKVINKFLPLAAAAAAGSGETGRLGTSGILTSNNIYMCNLIIYK